jgi:hypothetical protein
LKLAAGFSVLKLFVSRAFRFCLFTINIIRLAGTRERVGTRAVAQVHVRTRPRCDDSASKRIALSGIGFAPEMIAQAIMPHICFSQSTKAKHGRVFDIARACGLARDRGVGGICMSADVIQFIPRPNPAREPTDLPTMAFRFVPRSDDLTMDHVDTSPCEYLRPEPDEA